ncbi:MAG: VOC family protein [Proteobacteria bacterium]|nr:VOC family protein [Pseudomonadota bacterium]
MSNAIHEVYAYICVKNVKEAIDFYKSAFGAREHYLLTSPDGRVGHAELYLGNNILMLAEEFPEVGFSAPKTGEIPPVSIHLHVDNADDMFKAALAAGGIAEREPQDQFYGERSCSLRDPFGYRWMLGHSVEDVSVDEMQKRYLAMIEPAE